MLSISTCFVLLISGIFAEDFKCSENRITINDGVTGTLPSGATSMLPVPAKTNCTFKFDIPKGFALKMETSTVYDASPGDFVQFDTFFITSPADKEVEYTAWKELEVTIVSVTGNLTYFASYYYIDMTHFTQVIKPTGTYFNATLEPNKFYTIQASEGDTVTFDIGMRETGVFDQTLHNIFVFDGNDIVQSTYLSRAVSIYRIPDLHSTSNTLSFVNLYQYPSDSFIMGNDYSKIKNMEQYSVIVVDPIKATDGYFSNVRGHDDAYYTAICDGCSSFYIQSLDFDEFNSNESGFVEVQGLSPTQALPPLLNYPNSQFTNMSLPQLIPSPMATFHTFKSDIKYTIQPNSDWLTTSENKTRAVFSPDLWNPDAEQKFDYKFSDPLKVYNFSINLKSVQLLGDSDELDVQVGSVNGLTTLDKKYTKGVNNNLHIHGTGRYLQLTFTGSKSSEVKINFEMDLPNSNPVNPVDTSSTKTANHQSSSSTSATVSINNDMSTSTIIYTESSTKTPVQSSMTTYFPSTAPSQNTNSYTGSSTITEFTSSPSTATSQSTKSYTDPDVFTTPTAQSQSSSKTSIMTTSPIQTTTSSAFISVPIFSTLSIILFFF